MPIEPSVIDSRKLCHVLQRAVAGGYRIRDKALAGSSPCTTNQGCLILRDAATSHVGGSVQPQQDRNDVLVQN